LLEVSAAVDLPARPGEEYSGSDGRISCCRASSSAPPAAATTRRLAGHIFRKGGDKALASVIAQHLRLVSGHYAPKFDIYYLALFHPHVGVLGGKPGGAIDVQRLDAIGRVLGGQGDALPAAGLGVTCGPLRLSRLGSDEGHLLLFLQFSPRRLQSKVMISNNRSTVALKEGESEGSASTCAFIEATDCGMSMPSIFTNVRA